MSNFFNNHHEIELQIFNLMSQIHTLRIKDECERKHYMERLRNLIISKPNLTAASIAALMTDDLEERESIKASVAGLGYAAENNRKYKNPDIKHPSMPELKREHKTITRRFIELADDNSVIGEFKIEESKYVYSIGD